MIVFLQNLTNPYSLRQNLGSVRQAQYLLFTNFKRKMLEGERLLECMALLFEVLRVEDRRTNGWMINMWLKIAGCDGWMD